MRSVFVLPLALLAAPLAAQRSRSVVVVPGQMTQVITDTLGTAYPVPFPAAHAYRALVGVFKDLKLSADVKDSAAGVLETNVFHRRGDLAGKQISTYLGCGDGITGPNADHYRVYMVVMTRVEPKTENSSTIRTVLLGGAVNVAEGMRQPMACESTGRFEIRMHKEVVAKAAGLSSF
jgi:hypothetical protein